MQKAFVIFFLLFSSRVFASVPASYTAGVRFGSAIVQKLLASPPLPSLDSDDKSHVSVAVGYVTGKVDSHGPEPSGDFGYAGKPSGTSIGLGFTSQSYGDFSYFVYGAAMQAKTDTEVFSGAWKLTFDDTKLTASSIGFGLNYIALGSLNSNFTLGIFGGGLYTSTTHLSTFASDQFGPGAVKEKVNSKSNHFGPIAGIQFKVRAGPVAVSPYVMTYVDSTDHCVEMTLDSETTRCGTEINNSFTAAGVGLSAGNLKFVAYTQVWTRVQIEDLDLAVYQLSYTFDF